jgi:excisionase family DNA binding protein
MGTWMTEKDVAGFLGVSSSTVKSWRYRQLGPPYYAMHGAIRYRRAEVETWHSLAHRGGDGTALPPQSHRAIEAETAAVEPAAPVEVVAPAPAILAPAALFTAREVGAVLMVHTETIKRWARAGTIPAELSPGGQWLFRGSDIEACPVRTPIDPLLVAKAAKARQRLARRLP